MRGSAGLLLARNIFKQIYPAKGTWGGMLATSTPKKQARNDMGEEGKAEPIVAFRRPPPMPPVLGPLIALSLLETWSSPDSDY